VLHSDGPDLNLLSAIHITNLLRQREAKNIVDCLTTGADLGILNGSLANEVHHAVDMAGTYQQQPNSAANELGLDLSMSHHVTESTPSNGINEELRYYDEPEECGEIDEIEEYEHNDDNNHVGSHHKDIMSSSSNDSIMTQGISFSQVLKQMNGVPNLVTLKDTLENFPANDTNLETRNDKIGRGNKRQRVDSSCNFVNSSADELFHQKLKNEQDKNKLLKVQLENENLRKELFHVVLNKLKDGDNNMAIQVLKSILL